MVRAIQKVVGGELMMGQGWLRRVMKGWPSLALLASCGGPLEPSRSVRTKLETIPLVITEVAQATPYDGTTGDKVEVFCTNAGRSIMRISTSRRPMSEEPFRGLLALVK